MSASARRDLAQGRLTSGILRLAWPVTLGRMLAIAWLVQAALAGYRFRQGRWKLVRV